MKDTSGAAATTPSVATSETIDIVVVTHWPREGSSVLGIQAQPIGEKPGSVRRAGGTAMPVGSVDVTPRGAAHFMRSAEQ